MVPNPCRDFNTYVEIFGLNGCKVVIGEGRTPFAELLSVDEKIGEHNEYSDRGLVYINAPASDMVHSIPVGKSVIGVKLSNGRYGWIDFESDQHAFTFTIKSWGYLTNDATYIDRTIMK